MINVLGLYCGVGSMVGADMAGANVFGIVEPREEYHTGTYQNQLNYFSGLQFANKNTPLWSRYPELRPDRSTPLISISSPPCKRFSALGGRKKGRMENIEWKTTEIYKWCVWIYQVQPDIVILENVPKMTQFFSIETDDWKITEGDNHLTFKLPYDVQQFTTTASIYGVPQRRSRVFWILTNNNKAIDFVYKLPETILPQVTCGPFLENVAGLPNMELPKHSQKRIDGFAKLKAAESYYGGANNKRQDVNRLADVITSHRTQHVHPTESRTFTVRESARLMGYPDDFEFFGPRTKQLDQCGAAICPPIIKHMVEQINEYYEKKTQVPQGI